MKLATFKTGIAEYSTRVGLVLDESILDLSSAIGVSEMHTLIQNFTALRSDLDALQVKGTNLDLLKLEDVN